MLRFITFILAMSVFGNLALQANAAAPMVQAQVPGYYRYQLGQFEITALHDGKMELDAQLLNNINAQEVEQLTGRMFAGYPKIQGTVNAYLVNTGAHLVLVDAGASKAFNPNLGNLLDNMRAAGYTPAQVDTILLTHLHPDHVGALTDADGKPVFTNARIYTAKAESDYWLDKDAAQAAPASAQPMYITAQTATAPYITTGQWQPFAEGGTLVPGIKPVAAYGHTPGHTGYEVESEGQTMFIWGDVVHVHSVQFARPGVAIAFDVDQNMAVATRLSIMKKMASDKAIVAGMHLPFPGIGHVRMDAQDSYSWIPVEYSPMLDRNEN
ncbi:MAG: MBL fold metallo-hydrolase [Desulfobulbaceae bacterium]|nr:MBL fold metallo-hydrolase [Desulfobulbaceae bacterium]